MAAQLGLSFLLKQGTAAGGTTLAGMRSTSMTINQQIVDVTTKDSSNRWRELLAGAGVRSMTITAAGVFTDAAVEETVRGYAFAGSANAFGLIFANSDKIDASWIISSYSRAGEHDGEETYSITLESAGAITFTAG